MTPDMICPNSLFSGRALALMGGAKKSTLALEAVGLVRSIDASVMFVLSVGER
jgi:hypothetical protein